MNVRKLSVNKACIFLAVLLLAAMVTVSVALYALTQDITAVWYVLLFGIFVLFCSICFMVLVRRKLAMFSDAFCSLMDDMLSGNMQPKQMSAEELEVELKAIIAQVGATGPKDMGKVMGIASKALAGKAEGRMISEVVKKLLN